MVFLADTSNGCSVMYIPDLSPFLPQISTQVRQIAKSTIAVRCTFKNQNPAIISVLARADRSNKH